MPPWPSRRSTWNSPRFWPVRSASAGWVIYVPHPRLRLSETSRQAVTSRQPVLSLNGASGLRSRRRGWQDLLILGGVLLLALAGRQERQVVVHFVTAEDLA